MSRTARIRIATVLTVALIAALITAGLLVRGSAGSPATPQPVAVTTQAPQPSVLPAPAVAAPSLTVAGEDDEEGESYEGDDEEEGFDDD